ncbi:MAG: hypothetical protein ACOX8E_03105 [Ruminococcus sp.]|jgi:archaellum component FlaC
MTDSEKMDLLLSEIRDMRGDINGMKTRMDSMQKNIQFIAETYINITRKLNEAIPAADNNLAYEVKVNYLAEDVQILKRDVAMLKEKIT